MNSLADWAMRRLLSVDRDAASHFFDAPEDGRKWTISALVWKRLPATQRWVDFVDGHFWPGHCREAYEATMAGQPIETTTMRARLGAARVLWAGLLGRAPL